MRYVLVAPSSDDADAANDDDATRRAEKTEGDDDDGDARARAPASRDEHRGWLVLLAPESADDLPTPPEKPRNGEKTFATLRRNGDLSLATSAAAAAAAAATTIDLDGAELRVFTSGNAKKRWFKRHPFALIHPEGRPLYKGKSVVWCYASSDPAKEAWIVAIAGELKRRGGAMDRSVFAAAAAAAVAANGGEGGEMKINMKSEGGTDPAQRALVKHLAHRATVRKAAGASRARDDANFVAAAAASASEGEEGASDEAGKMKAAASALAMRELAWSSGGAAGATINALLSRVLFDALRDAEELEKIRRDLDALLADVPDLPKIVSPPRIERVTLGKATPQIVSARVPANATADDVSAAPWDGGALANRGPCSCVELDVAFDASSASASANARGDGAAPEITLKTHVDLRALTEGGGGGGGGDASSSVGGGGAESGAESGAAAATTDSLTPLKNFAKTAVNAVAKTLENTPLTLTVRLLKLSGTLRVWIPPPPGDRVWFGFVDEPVVEMAAAPAVGTYGIRWKELGETVSGLITRKLRREIVDALVLPNAGNVVAEALSPWDAAAVGVVEVTAAELIEVTRRALEGDASRGDERGKEKEKEKETTTTTTTTLAKTQHAMDEVTPAAEVEEVAEEVAVEAATASSSSSPPPPPPPPVASTPPAEIRSKPSPAPTPDSSPTTAAVAWLNKVQSNMKTDFSTFKRGVEAGGAKGGFAAAVNIAQQRIKEELRAAQKKAAAAGTSSGSPRSPKVYGEGKEIPYDPLSVGRGGKAHAE